MADAVVAETTMRLLNLDEVQICPWTLREGILLRHAETGTTRYRRRGVAA